jgi:hypothetical protein
MPEEKKRVGAGFGVILEKDGKILLGLRHPDPDKADSAFRSAVPNNEPSRPPSSEQFHAAPVQTLQTQAVITSANTSGRGHGAIVPSEVRGWNWGAFLLSWIWGLGNETYLSLLCFVPFVNFVMIFVLGAKGNEWAWHNKQWTSIEDFKRVQRRWAIAGAIVLVAVVLIAVGGFWYCKKNHQAKPITAIPSSPATETNTTTTQIARSEGCVLQPSGDTVSLSRVSDYTTEDMRGGMVCNFIINPQLPIFTFHFVGESDNNLGNIDITEGTNANIIQTIPNVTSWDATLTSPENTLTIVDANFDGYGDLSILNNCGVTGNCSYDFYLYNPTTNQFIRDAFLSNLGTPSFNEVKKQVMTSWNTSVADYESDTYQYTNGQYILTKQVVSAWDRNDKSSPGGTVTLQTFELQNGVMKLINSTTVPSS